MNNYLGVNLQIIGNDSTVYLNKTSTTLHSQSGTITIPDSNLPYTISVSDVKGGANMVNFRVCDTITGELYYITGIQMFVNSPYNQTISPTPLNVTVEVCSGNQTPPTCPV